MINAHAHPAFVATDIVDAVRNRFAEVGIDEVVDLYAFRMTFGVPLTTAVLEMPVARVTVAAPPGPNAFASAAAHSRSIRSSITGASASYFIRIRSSGVTLQEHSTPISHFHIFARALSSSPVRATTSWLLNRDGSVSPIPELISMVTVVKRSVQIANNRLSLVIGQPSTLIDAISDVSSQKIRHNTHGLRTGCI